VTAIRFADRWWRGSAAAAWHSGRPRILPLADRHRLARDGNGLFAALLLYGAMAAQRCRDERARSGHGKMAGHADDLAIPFDVQHRGIAGAAGRGDRGTRRSRGGSPVAARE